MKKQSFGKKVLAGCAVVAMAATLSACGGSGSSADLVIYSPNSDPLIDNVIPAFEEETGLKVDVQPGGTGDIITRIDGEKANPQADIQYGGLAPAQLAQYPDNYEEYTSKYDAEIPEQYRVYKGVINHYGLDGSAAIIINNEKCEELGVDPASIDSYESLLNPKLKGQIAMGNPAKSSSAWAELCNMLLVMGDEPYDQKAWDWVAKFVDNLDGKILDSSSAIYKGTVDGEYAVGVSYEDPCIGMLDDGAEGISVIYPKEGAVWLPAGVAVIKGAPHQENAQKFIDFLLSEKGQACVAKTTNRPVREGVNNESKNMKPLSELNVKVEDQQFTADHKEEWGNKWNELCGQ